jgi:hypothetical protein
MIKFNLQFELLFKLLCFFMILSCQKGVANKDIDRANITLQHILKLYTVETNGLFTETYPVNPNQQVTYLADNKGQTKSRKFLIFGLFQESFPVAYPCTK